MSERFESRFESNSSNSSAESEKRGGGKQIRYCSFCGKGTDEDESQFISGPNAALICDKCVDLMNQGLKAHLKDSWYYSRKEEPYKTKFNSVENPAMGLRCSFCGKKPKKKNVLIVGPKHNICDECVELCNMILEEKLESWIWIDDLLPNSSTDDSDD